MYEKLNWIVYINQMEKILELKLNEEQRAELIIQFDRIAIIAEKLMDIKLDDRLEIAGVFHP